jgi:sugar/nucleoside kinase (ribokinase family)
MACDVFGLGNALVDALVVTDDLELVRRHGLQRGTMHLVSDERWRAVYSEVPSDQVELHPGGSGANSVSMVAMLGGDSTFCGLVGSDVLGQTYAERLGEIMGHHYLRTRDDVATGKCLSIISSADAERTMLTDLGGAMELGPAELPVEAVEKATWLHLTGYLFTGGQMGDAAMLALDRALHAGTRISFDVADAFVIQHCRDTVEKVIRDYADVVFMNEEEARMLAGGDAAEAVHKVGAWVDTAVVKLGKRGSIIKKGDTIVPIEAVSVDAVDTTGAGDAYAGGFLYGLARGWQLEACGHLASAVAGLTVSQVGGVVRDRDKLGKALARVEAEA